VNNPINVAQKVRLWFMLGLSILCAICIIGLGAVPGYQLAVGGGQTWYVWIVLTLAADITLGSISVYRFLHPIAPPQQEYPPPQAQQYPAQPGFGPGAPIHGYVGPSGQWVQTPPKPAGQAPWQQH
jgi:hypothetical protein